MKRLMSLTLVFIILLSCLPTILALPNTSNKIKDSVRIPEHAVRIADGVFSLGNANVEGRIAQGFLFVRYTQGFAKPEGTPGVGPDKGKDTSDPAPYELMAKGLKWKTVEPYVLRTATSDLSASFTEDDIASLTSTCFGTWENPEQGVVLNIFGDRDALQLVDGADIVAPDGKNEIFFGSIDEDRVIAVTIVWGYFTGPPQLREIIEYDMVFDEVDFDWGIVADGEDLMDFQNIATHEIGHALGLADLYDNAASEQTMYGYASEGETIKRDLAAGDIAGVEKLYS